MAEFAKRLIPLNKTLTDRVFPVVKTISKSLTTLRKAHRGDEDSLSYRRGCPTVTVSNSHCNVLTMNFSIAGKNRSLNVWFDYTDCEPDELKNGGTFNLYLHIGDWGSPEIIFDSIEDAIKQSFTNDCL